MLRIVDSRQKPIKLICGRDLEYGEMGIVEDEDSSINGCVVIRCENYIICLGDVKYNLYPKYYINPAFLVRKINGTLTIED